MILEIAIAFVYLLIGYAFFCVCHAMGAENGVKHLLPRSILAGLFWPAAIVFGILLAMWKGAHETTYSDEKDQEETEKFPPVNLN